MTGQDQGQPGGELSKERVEALIRSDRWQDEAEALAYVKRAKAWRNFVKPDGIGNYRSFSQFAMEYEMAPSTAYEKAALAENPRFAQVRELDIKLATGRALLRAEVEQWLFDALVLLRKLGTDEKELARILSSKEAATELRAFAHQKIQEQETLIGELRRALQI